MQVLFQYGFSELYMSLVFHDALLAIDSCFSVVSDGAILLLQFLQGIGFVERQETNLCVRA